MNHGRASEVRVGVEVLPIVTGLSMVQVVKGRGTSVEFYSFYAKLAQQLQGLISRNALALAPADAAHQAALMTGQQSSQEWPSLSRTNSKDLQAALESMNNPSCT